MDVLLKKYFWILTLGVTGVCAALGGRTASRFITQSFLVADESQAPSRRAYVNSADRVRSKEVEGIVKRNVFCSACSPIVPSGDNPAGPVEEISNEPRRTEMQLELVSTMVVPGDEKWSMAVIRDTSTKEKDPGLYRSGSLLPGDAATVVRIIEKKVYFTNNNHLEYLELDPGANAKVANAGGGNEYVAMAQPVSAATGDPLDNDINRGVRCVGSNCEIDRSLVDKLLSNTTMLATSARFVPSIKDGRPNGFKLYAIRPNSIFGKIGLQNGDTVKSINGMEMSSPDQALGVYTKVRTASHLTVSVERRGETATLDYTIR
ncbi:MAG: hypothetical protein EXR72_01485 [Myxococcales bacterium]|nr:hypothetical protein [Myxococcales bacterium]